MDGKIRLYNLLIKAVIIFLVAFLVIYNAIYAFKLDFIYWAVVSSGTLVVLFVLLICKFVFKLKHDKTVKKNAVWFVISAAALIISVNMVVFAIKQINGYSFSYSPGGTNSIIIEKEKWRKESFIYAYKMKYGMFKNYNERLVFASGEPTDKASVIVWSNEDDAYVEGKYLDFYDNSAGNVELVNKEKKYFLNFN